MNTHRITIAPFTGTATPAVADLMIAQDTRQSASDPRLRPVRQRALVATALARAESGEARPLLALDACGRVRGYAQPSVWPLAETSMLRAFLSARNGVALNLTLPDPADDDALAVATALLAALTDYWKRNATSGDLIRWPSCDSWIEPMLREQGFQLDSVCAAYPRQPLAPPSRAALSSPLLHSRRARPEDEEALVSLLHEELRFHERYTPFVRSSPGVLGAFRRKLGRLWGGASLEEGAPLIIVAERDGQIVGMGENTLLVLGPEEEPGFTPPGRYACIDNVSVREDVRGQGIGRQLTQAAFESFGATEFEAYILWYNPDNTLAARVWTHLGFQPLWTTYQRLHTAGGDAIHAA